MGVPLRIQFGRLCRETRSMLDITQLELARAAGVSRSFLAEVELGRGSPSFDVATRIGDALGLELQIVGRRTIILAPRTRDAVHARCSRYADRRLRAARWLTQREVELADRRAHGWIDLLAYHPVTRTLLIVEIKTRLDDVGAVERQLGWYERAGPRLARTFGWRVDRSIGCLLLLASDEVDRAVRAESAVLRLAFPARASELQRVIDGAVPPAATGRALALIDPSSRRRAWLLPTRSDGRRTAAPYRDYADAARRFGG